MHFIIRATTYPVGNEPIKLRNDHAKYSGFHKIRSYCFGTISNFVIRSVFYVFYDVSDFVQLFLP